MLNKVAESPLSLCMQFDVLQVSTMLTAGQVLACLVHIVKAVLEIIFKVCCNDSHDGNVVVSSYLLTGEVDSTATSPATTLVVSELLVVFGMFNKAFGAEPFRKAVVVSL